MFLRSVIPRIRRLSSGNSVLLLHARPPCIYMPLISSRVSHGLSVTAGTRCLRFYTPGNAKVTDMSTDDEFLSQEQRDQLFRGIFPADYSGEVISIKTSRAEYSRLFEAFEKSTNKFVFLFLLSLCTDAYCEIYRRSQSAILKFDKTFHTTSIQLRQVSIHNCVISNVSAQLRKLMPLDPKRFSFMEDTEIDDALPGPDLQMVWLSNIGVIPVLAMEVGFSQPSLDLEMTIRNLLQKTSVKVGILVDIKESPSYKNPLRKEQNIEICKAAMQASTDKPELLIDQYCAGRELFSPVVLYGIQWVGELTAAVQVFGKDSVTGDVVARTPRVVRTMNHLLCCTQIQLTDVDSNYIRHFSDIPSLQRGSSSQGHPSTKRTPASIPNSQTAWTQTMKPTMST
ncbi:hypothetical protein H101_07446 [Trichophyton interdigitale H6]|nr:hypothetical protein H101_07446 [Trichophyton interdigitale H6]